MADGKKYERIAALWRGRRDSNALATGVLEWKGQKFSIALYENTRKADDDGKSRPDLTILCFGPKVEGGGRSGGGDNGRRSEGHHSEGRGREDGAQSRSRDEEDSEEEDSAWS